IHNRERYYEISDLYPDNYVYRDLLVRGKGALIRSGVYLSANPFSPNHEIIIDKAKVMSTVEHHKNIFEAFFSPERKTKQYFEIFDMVLIDLSQVFSVEEHNKYFRESFWRLLHRVSLGWRLWCSNPVEMAHYGQTVRYVSRFEMVQNIFKAYRDTKAHLKEKGTYSLSRQLIMWHCVLSMLFLPVTVRAKNLWKKIKTFPRHDHQD
ncbi:MAG: hypothetical protein II917_03500, partial [Synergistaceae bacterium]|nr:hypothetical protein [Synergistaceae bacterium]